MRGETESALVSRSTSTRTVSAGLHPHGLPHAQGLSGYPRSGLPMGPGHQWVPSVPTAACVPLRPPPGPRST